MTLLRFYAKVASVLSRVGIGRLPGVRTLYRFLYGKLPRPTGMILLDIQGSKMYLNSKDKGVDTTLLVHGVYEAFETDLIKRIIGKGMVVVDIGANIGYYTLIASRLVGNKGRVYAFEPEPSNYQRLCKNIAANRYENVVSVCKAASNINGTAKLYVNPAHTGSSSFAEDHPVHSTEAPQCCLVETITLDSFFEQIGRDIKVDFIKVDAEGAEGLVWDGAQKVLGQPHLTMFMEFTPNTQRSMGTDPLGLLGKITNCGFTIQFINSQRRILETITDFESFVQRPEFCVPGSRNLLLMK